MVSYSIYANMEQGPVVQPRSIEALAPEHEKIWLCTEAETVGLSSTV
jgi:hypothetical protein